MSLLDSYTNPDIPGVFTEVIDNSIAETDNLSKRTVFVVGPSKFGSDGLTPFETTENLASTLGDENTFKYGLGQFYAKSFILAGANVLFKRIDDPTATYANQLLYKNPAYYGNPTNNIAADYTKEPMAGAFFGDIVNKDTLISPLPITNPNYSAANEAIKENTILSLLATGKGNGYTDLFTTFTDAKDYEKFEADDDGLENYKFNFIYGRVLESGAEVKKKSTSILFSLIDIDPEKKNVISHRSSGTNLYVNEIFEKSNLYMSMRINSAVKEEMRKYPTIDSVLTEKNKNFLYVESSTTFSDVNLLPSERIWYEIQVDDSGKTPTFKIQRATFTSRRAKRDFAGKVPTLPTFLVDGKKYILTIEDNNGKLSVKHNLINMAEETTYAEGEPAYIDGTEAYYTFVLRKNSANGNIEIITDKFRFLRWEVYSYLRKYNLKLNGGKDSTASNGFLNLDGSANVTAIANATYQYLVYNKEIREVVYPKFIFNYMIDWTQNVKVIDAMYLLADRLKRAMHIAHCPSVRLNETGLSQDYSKENDLICREQYLTRSSYNTMLYSSQNNREHYDPETKLSHRLPSSFYALLNHLYIDNSSLGITEPVANIEKGIIRTQTLKLSHELYSEDIAELRKQQINCIVSDGNTNYFIDQITSYKKKSKLSLGNVVKTIQYLQVLIPAKLKPYLQKKETDPAITTNAMNELQEILKPYKVNVNSKDAIFKTVVIKQSFNDNVLQLLLRLNPAGTTEKIEVPIIVEG